MYFPYKRLIPNDLNMKRVYVFSGLGFMAALLLVFLIRGIFLQDNTVHYHANFALYVNEEQDKFESPLFYEEVQSCSAENENDPKTRTHMHNNENDVAHVHDSAVTWGHFFANLGYGLTNDAITTDEGIFVNGQDGKKLTFYLNDQAVQSIANTVINNEDMLLVDYGTGKDIQAKFDKIPANAHEHNVKPDPASCSGSDELSAKDKLLKIIKFWE
ncbi:MAG TPA: hypothetical protein VD947_02210 [Patescibacteria group bacterium]|nr:hypothetical protein [Patescibacteria group bacterium]